MAAAALGLWSANASHSRPLAWLAAALALLSAALALLALRARWQHAQAPGSAPEKDWCRRGWLRLLAFGFSAILLAALATVNWLARDRALALVRPAHIQPGGAPLEEGIPDYQEVSFTTQDGLRLGGWYLPARNGAVVILIHGHGSNRAQLLADAHLLADRGFGALLYDARNCGASQGDLTTFGLLEVEDVRGAVIFLQAQPSVDPQRIGLLGHSMGGATAILAAAAIPEIRAAVSQSTYTSLEENIANGVRAYVGLPPFPFAPLIIFWGELESGMQLNQVRPVEAIGLISPRPVLVVHGALDEIIPVENAYQLYEAANQPKELYILEAAGHCCLPQIGGEQYLDRVIGFFERHLLERK
ncbi:MAG: alpha/beta fold hydrolase [Anaerolineales bacterium]|nr:alpha/beta fold hydrolase [Anaerolineales bacterium]